MRDGLRIAVVHGGSSLQIQASLLRIAPSPGYSLDIQTESRERLPNAEAVQGFLIEAGKAIIGAGPSPGGGGILPARHPYEEGQ